jgi:penicillin-binding protein 2D
MLNSFRNSFLKDFFKNLSLRYLVTVLFLIVLGGLLLALYLPVPTPQIPTATEVYDRNQKLVTTFFLQNRRPVSLNEIPPFLLKAFLAVEDHRFYQHHGINPGRIIKAVWNNFTHHQLLEGASTITQQLAKNVYLSQERTYLRKIKELFYTVKLELHYSKDEILELYLNQIYFGHGAYGLKVAAETYFDKKLDQMNQAEMALLAGLPKGPAFYSPFTHPDDARQRLSEVLQRMVDCNFITTEEFNLYNSQPLRLSRAHAKTRPAPYFLDLVQNEVEQIFPKEPGLIYRAGLIIYSTLDPGIQTEAEETLTHGLPKLLHDRQGLIQPQGALIAIDPSTGEIRALVGGTDINKSQFNRAIQARRQPGSAFKPILYAAALDHGYTLSSHFDRSPASYTIGSRIYRPTDGDNENTSGMLSLREALASSSNVVSVKLLNQLGLPPVIELAKKLGINSVLPSQLSLALGSGEVTPMELTSAYIPLANGGVKFPPTTIRRILDRDGHILYQSLTEHPRVINPGVAYLVTQALTGVLHEGGTASNIGGILNRPAAGKTGTTEENRDAWFIGYTPDLLAGVYVGCDHNERPLPGAANQVAAPIWADFMAKALDRVPARDFIIPNEVIEIPVCTETGAKATAFCPKRLEYFLTGTEPTEYCSVHRVITLEICKRSGLLPSPYCRHLEIRQFALGKQPLETCQTCKKRLPIFDWFRRFFHPDR